MTKRGHRSYTVAQLSARITDEELAQMFLSDEEIAEIQVEDDKRGHYDGVTLSLPQFHRRRLLLEVTALKQELARTTAQRDRAVRVLGEFGEEALRKLEEENGD